MKTRRKYNLKRKTQRKYNVRKGKRTRRINHKKKTRKNQKGGLFGFSDKEKFTEIFVKKYMNVVYYRSSLFRGLSDNDKDNKKNIKKDAKELIKIWEETYLSEIKKEEARLMGEPLTPKQKTNLDKIAKKHLKQAWKNLLSLSKQPEIYEDDNFFYDLFHLQITTRTQNYDDYFKNLKTRYREGTRTLDTHDSEGILGPIPEKYIKKYEKNINNDYGFGNVSHTTKERKQKEHAKEYDNRSFLRKKFSPFSPKKEEWHGKNIGTCPDNNVAHGITSQHRAALSNICYHEGQECNTGPNKKCCSKYESSKGKYLLRNEHLGESKTRKTKEKPLIWYQGNCKEIMNSTSKEKRNNPVVREIETQSESLAEGVSIYEENPSDGRMTVSPKTPGPGPVTYESMLQEEQRKRLLTEGSSREPSPLPPSPTTPPRVVKSYKVFPNYGSKNTPELQENTPLIYE